MGVSTQVFGRKHFYLLAGGVGLVWGLLIGIGQRRCPHPAQPPFLRCIAEDPAEVIVPTVLVTVYLLALAGVLDLVYRALRHLERFDLVMMLAGGVLVGLWARAVKSVCRTDALDSVNCLEFSDWPGILGPILAGVLVFGLVGRLVARIRHT